ncbi:hypothetical protein Calab_3270 [Caldithrix abyssi DSM 13497]|uniref:Uncharacterized protein n=1 Tax=Caldithrix abyssi DSM 13497 TaxID=880073 RepID=H1XV41_CALAY|nr:hypothetical protein Cabys_2165 [Caldithrix abyssi DSM 13497]EHO42874.1 hypothetical protein Calab_3270 [Caldithrix abyssi DSM 13497]
MRFWGLRKHKEFDLESRLHAKDKKRIQFERLPRRKVRSLWWTLIVFLIVLYLYFYLKKMI